MTTQNLWDAAKAVLRGKFGCFGLVAKSCLTLATPWTVAWQTSLSIGFSRQEYWSGLPFPSPGDLPNPGIKSGSLVLQADSLPTELWVYSNTILPQETRKSSNRKPNFTPKTTGKRTTPSPQKMSRRKEIIRIQAEINEKGGVAKMAGE